MIFLVDNGTCNTFGQNGYCFLSMKIESRQFAMIGLKSSNNLIQKDPLFLSVSFECFFLSRAFLSFGDDTLTYKEMSGYASRNACRTAFQTLPLQKSLKHYLDFTAGGISKLRDVVLFRACEPIQECNGNI